MSEKKEGCSANTVLDKNADAAKLHLKPSHGKDCHAQYTSSANPDVLQELLGEKMLVMLHSGSGSSAAHELSETMRWLSERRNPTIVLQLHR